MGPGRKLIQERIVVEKTTPIKIRTIMKMIWPIVISATFSYGA